MTPAAESLDAEALNDPAPPRAEADRRTARRRVWRRTAGLWLGLLAAYWSGLFAGTHTGTRDMPSGIWDYDKLLHAGAYFGLATLLLIAWRRTGAWPTWRGRLAVAAVALAYGALDEITQPLAGRQCELFDWLADAAGVAAAVGIDQWRHGRR